jgi:hypothetical protein
MLGLGKHIPLFFSGETTLEYLVSGGIYYRGYIAVHYLQSPEALKLSSATIADIKSIYLSGTGTGSHI